jgi:hypothetical protein
MPTLDQYPHIRPRPGLVFEAYLSRKDIGSGIKLLVVQGAGRKYVHIFHPAHLYTFTIKHREWATMLQAPVLTFDAKRFRRAIAERARSFDRLGIKYSKRNVNRILGLHYIYGLRIYGPAHALAQC